MTDLDEVREQYHRAVEAFITGDPEPHDELWSKRDDVTLANPLGPPVRGWDAVRDARCAGACRVATPRR
jgi:RNase P/RNase MRP subunit p30